MTPLPSLLPHESGMGNDHYDDATSTPDAGSKDASGPGSAARQTVLLVEDDSSLVDPWRDSLRFAGYECVIAGDVATALTVLSDERQRIAVMVADLNLAGSDGAALVRAARGMARHAALPIIITSGDETRDARERARRAGMDAYLVKPVATRTLLDTIARWTRAKP